jgi:hypoxanthine phosphoribosyltransferase
MTWEEFGGMSQQLLEAVQESGYNPEVIVSILRGGQYPAEYIAQAIQAQLAQIRVRRTTSNEVFSQKQPPQIVEEESNYHNAVVGKRVLLVDDIATFGETLAAAQQAILDAGASEVRSATLICHNPDRLQASAIDFSTHMCEPRDWFVFPWEQGEDYK